MRPLYLFILELVLPVGTVDWTRLENLPALIEGYSAISHESLSIRKMSPNGAISREDSSLADAIGALRAGTIILFSADRKGGISPRHGGPPTEGIALGTTPLFPEVFTVTVHLNVDGASREALFSALCELVRPRHCYYLPEYDDRGGNQDITLEMALQRKFTLYGIPDDDNKSMRARTIAPLLPRLDGPLHAHLSRMPQRLGWLNYWHPKVAAELRFPDAENDGPVLSLSRRSESGAWLVKLTAESLDLTRADHVEAITRAYWRFDKIGTRLRPAAKKYKPRVKRTQADVARAQGMKVFIVRERDELGRWWDAVEGPIAAASPEDALRRHFARVAHGRVPRAAESLETLRDAYDGVAAEVGLTASADIEAVEAEPGSSPS